MGSETAARDCCPRFRVLASAAHGRHPRSVRALLARGDSAARDVAAHREERGAGRGRALLSCLGQCHGHSHRGGPRPRGYRQFRHARPHLRRGARRRSRAPRRRRLHAWACRPRMRPAALPGRGQGERAPGARHRRPPECPRPLRSVPDDGALERAHQLASVLRRRHLAHRVPVPRDHLRHHARPRGRRRQARAHACSRRDGRPHLAVVAGPTHPLHRRPLLLGGAKRGKPPEGPAVRRGVGAHCASWRNAGPSS